MGTGTNTLQVINKISALRQELATLRATGQTVALVPTMGALHAGHLSLVKRATELADVVVLSIFLNPRQFRPSEDYAQYPRSLKQDVANAEAAGVDLIFAPSNAEIYPDEFQTTVTVGPQLTSTLCGATRGPEHFQGVATVVVKLLNIVQPDVALFGMKDAQQVLVIERCVRDLSIPVQIERCPTVREFNGLALSSRNQHLTAEQRADASTIFATLRTAKQLVDDGEGLTGTELCTYVRAHLVKSAIEIEYVELVDSKTLAPVANTDKPALLAIAARIGTTRLIDNISINFHKTNS